MIAYIEGKIDELTTDTAVVEASGVGYELAVSLQTYEAIRGKERARLYVYEQFRQDQAMQLFGFATRAERTLFRLLLGVSGVGGQTARSVVSAYSPEDLSRIIADEDTRALTAIKGIGKKAAERIVVELRDEVGIDAASATNGTATYSGGALPGARQEAALALTSLGFPSAVVGKTVSAIVAEQPDLPVGEIIKLALKQMSAK